MASGLDRIFDREFFSTLAALRGAFSPDLASRPFGTRPVRKQGGGQEFYGHRSYEQGDDLRSIDWNAYGRSEKLFTKTFLKEESGTLLLLIDASESMRFGEPSKFDEARRIAGLLGALSLWNDGKIQAYAGSNSWSGIGAQDAMLVRWLSFLSSVRIEPGSSPGAGLARMAIPGRGARLRLISDCWDLPDSADSLLSAAARMESSTVVRLLSPEETDPEPAGVVRLQDSESSRLVRVSVDEGSIRSYRELMDRWTASCRSICSRAGVEWVDLSPDDDLNSRIQACIGTTGGQR